MLDTFMKIDGIPGESTDSKHKDWIELTKVEHDFQQPSSATASSAGGATSERVNMNDLAVQKALDKASAKIYEACCNGKHIKEVTIEMCRAGGDQLKYMEIKLEEVIVSGVELKKDGEFPAEKISFNFGKIKRETGNWEVELETKPAMDIAVRMFSYAAHSTTGWHSHPGPVFIQVVQGAVTFYEGTDPNCTPRVVRAGESYLDLGDHPHIGRNETGQPAQDLVVLFGPPGIPSTGFRIEEAVPGNCPF